MHSLEKHNCKGRRVTYDAVFWNSVPNDIDWYKPMDKKDDYIIIT